MLLDRKEQEKIITNLLHEYFLGKEINYFHEYQNFHYRQINNKFVNEFCIQTSSSGYHYFEHFLSFYGVETIIMDVGVPNNKLEAYKSGILYLQTVKSDKKLDYDVDINPVKTKLGCLAYVDSIIKYIESEGINFTDKYSYLPNVLKEMNKLECQGKYWHQGLLVSADPFFCGLIISKLCNDPEYDKKFDFVESLYFPPENKLTANIPYLEKLKERLKTVKPIYNV